MIRKYAEIFCWKNVSSFCSAKATHIFSAKNIRILYIESAKTVNEMTLNEHVKLTTLWTTGPWSLQDFRLGSVTQEKYKKKCTIMKYGGLFMAPFGSLSLSWWSRICPAFSVYTQISWPLIWINTVCHSVCEFISTVWDLIGWQLE